VVLVATKRKFRIENKAYCLGAHTTISQHYDKVGGSVATCLRCGGIFHGEFIANLPGSLLVKEF